VGRGRKVLGKKKANKLESKERTLFSPKREEDMTPITTD
jgi:hypothetical protein